MASRRTKTTSDSRRRTGWHARASAVAILALVLGPVTAFAAEAPQGVAASSGATETADEAAGPGAAAPEVDAPVDAAEDAGGDASASSEAPAQHDEPAASPTPEPTVAPDPTVAPEPTVAPDSAAAPAPAPTPEPSDATTPDLSVSPAPTEPATPAPEQTDAPDEGDRSDDDGRADDAVPSDEAVPSGRGERVLTAKQLAAAAAVSSFCSADAWSLDSGDWSVHPVIGGSVQGGAGWLRPQSGPIGGLAISSDGATSYAASVADGTVTVQRLQVQLGYSDIVETQPAALTAVDGGAVGPEGRIYFFGGYRTAGASTFFDLYGYNVLDDAWIGQLASIRMPAAAIGGGTGDIVFDALGNLLLLWSDATSSVLANVARDSVPRTAGVGIIDASAGSVVVGANVAGSPWTGIAYDAIGQLWLQGTNGADSVSARLNRTSGAVTDQVTAAGQAGVDLASCGPSMTLVLQTDIQGRRVNAADQFALRVASEGSSASLGTATTSGTALGVQTAKAGPLPISAAARYVIGQSGAGGASPADYTSAYGCVWASGGTAFVAAGTPLAYNASVGRAQVALPAIPTGHDGDTLTCTIVNTAKASTAVQPKLTLAKALSGGRAAAGDQFRLEVLRTGSTSAISVTTTTGTGSTIATGTTPAAVAEIGQTYTIAESAASGDLSRYSATFACAWPDGTEFARGALAISGGRMQTQLPAIPVGHDAQTLACVITNQVRPLSGGLSCVAGDVYGVTANGVYRVTAAAADTTPRYTGSGANALAVNLDGSAATTAGITSGNVQVQRWTAAGGSGPLTTVTRSTSQTGSVAPPAIVGGAIDPTTGVYYFGGYTAGTPAVFNLYVSSGTTYWQAARIQIDGSANATSNNGDIAFDAQGNLYLVWSNGGSAATSHILARVNADRILRAQPTDVPTLTSTRVTYLTANVAVNGVTFDASGQLYISYTNGYRRLNPATGAEIANSARTMTGVVDLAACGLPPTMKLQKDIRGTGRVNAADQFRIEILSGSTIMQEATTSGSAVGIQSQVAGPAVVTVGESYTIRETAAGGANLNSYITGYICNWSDETKPVASGALTGTATVRSAALPSIPAGKAGQQLVCTITNEPLVPATLTVKKTLLDSRGHNPVPASGWTMTADANGGTNGGGTIGGSVDPVLQTTVLGGSIAAPWDVVFPLSSSTVGVEVNETQQSGYQFVSGTCTITPRVGEAGAAVLITSTSVQLTQVRPGDAVECEFRNQPLPGSVTWQKVDEQGQHLSGSAWALSGPGVPPGFIVSDCIAGSAAECGTGDFTDRDPRAGHFRLVGLSNGNHTIVEETAPAGYERRQDLHRLVIDVRAPQSSCSASAAGDGVPRCLNVDYDQPFVNALLAMPALPLTGGMASDAFMIVGGGLSAVSLIIVAFFHRRRRRGI